MCCFISCVIYSLLVSLKFFFFKQKTAYEMRISDWSSDVCSSDLVGQQRAFPCQAEQLVARRDQRIMALAAVVLEVERVAAGDAKLGHRRGREHEDGGVLDLAHRGHAATEIGRAHV